MSAVDVVVELANELTDAKLVRDEGKGTEKLFLVKNGASCLMGQADRLRQGLLAKLGQDPPPLPLSWFEENAVVSLNQLGEYRDRCFEWARTMDEHANSTAESKANDAFQSTRTSLDAAQEAAFACLCTLIGTSLASQDGRKEQHCVGQPETRPA